MHIPTVSVDKVVEKAGAECVVMFVSFSWLGDAIY